MVHAVVLFKIKDGLFYLKNSEPAEKVIKIKTSLCATLEEFNANKKMFDGDKDFKQKKRFIDKVGFTINFLDR